MRYALLLIFVSSFSLASEVPWERGGSFRNTQNRFSTGVTIYNSPMSGNGSSGSINDRSMIWDFIVPVTRNFTVTTSYGYREQIWRLNREPDVFSGYSYSVGARFYLGD